jgi:hypothetical protein
MQHLYRRVTRHLSSISVVKLVISIFNVNVSAMVAFWLLFTVRIERHLLKNRIFHGVE